MSCFIILFIVPFVIRTSLQSITANGGDNASFTFYATGSYIINVTWLAPDNHIFNATQDVATISTIIRPTNATSSLHFYNLQRSLTEGWYTCIVYYAVYNFSIISVRSRAFLNVQGMIIIYIHNLLRRSICIFQLHHWLYHCKAITSHW